MQEAANSHSGTGIRLVDAAWKELPPDQYFPCDGSHLILIQNFGDFLKAHPNLYAIADMRERARRAF